MAAIKTLIPPMDGESYIRLTSVIKEGQPAPTILFTGTISPDVVTAMVLNDGPVRHKAMMDISAHLMQRLNTFCDVALGPPGGK